MSLLPFRFTVKSLIENNRTNQSDIETIKQWLDTTSLPQIQDEFIVLFLLSTLNDITATKQTIEAYFRVKNKAPEIFNGWNLESADLKKSSKVMSICLIPAKMDNNVAVCCMRMDDSNYRNFDVVPIIKHLCMVFHLCQMYDPPNELVLTYDFAGFGFMHLTCLKMGAIITFLEYIQEAVPLKIRNIHVLNSTYLLDKILRLFKMFIKSDLMESIKMHYPGMDMKEFQENWIPASCLPEEYEGTLPEFDEMAKKTNEDLKKIQPFFEAEERLRSSYRL